MRLGCAAVVALLALWLIAASILVLAWRARQTDGLERSNTIRVLIAAMAGGVFLVPWLGVMLDQSAHTGTPWASPVRPTTLVTTTLQDFGGGDYAEGLLLGWSTAVLFLVGLMARSIDRSRIELDVRTLPLVRREAIVVGLTITIASIVGALTRTTFATRYAAVFFPLFLLVAAVGLTRFSGAAVRGVLATGLLLLGSVGGVHNLITDRTQAGKVADGIRDGAVPGDVVLICPDQMGPSVHRLLPASLGLTQLSYPTRSATRRSSTGATTKTATRSSTPWRSPTTSWPAPGARTRVWLVESTGYKTLKGQCEGLTRSWPPSSVRAECSSGKTATRSSSTRPCCSTPAAPGDPTHGGGRRSAGRPPWLDRDASVRADRLGGVTMVDRPRAPRCAPDREHTGSVRMGRGVLPRHR